MPQFVTAVTGSDRGWEMDFAALPPEINSGLMYTGPGAGSMLAAATAWGGLAAELHLAASAYQAVLHELTGASWSGPSSAAMTAAVSPYVVWLNTTAVRAEQAGTQAKAAAAAYEAAFALTVPPSVVAANRAQLMSLVATNVFGQNTAAIAATEVHYGEMWAQDAAAMNGYAATAAATTKVDPFAPPPKTTDQTGSLGQVGAVEQALGNAAGTNTQAAPMQLASAMQGLASPAQSAPPIEIPPIEIPDPVTGFFDAFGILADELGVGVALPLSIVGVWLAGAAMYYAELDSREIIDAQDMLAGGQSTILDALEEMAAAIGSHAFADEPPLAGVGEAVSAGNLSVPPSWATAAEEIQTTAYAAPMPAGATSTMASIGTTFSQMAIAGMAGSALAGAIRSTGGGSAGAGTDQPGSKPAPVAGKTERPIAPQPEPTPHPSRPTPRPSLASVREMAEGLRELGDLRDSGLLSEVEFAEQKRRLLGH